MTWRGQAALSMPRFRMKAKPDIPRAFPSTSLSATLAQCLHDAFPSPGPSYRSLAGTECSMPMDSSWRMSTASLTEPSRSPILG